MNAFKSKFEYVVKALSLSRGQIAAELAMDKSVVSRWLSGTRQPTSTGLASLTSLVARRIPGFTMLDWDLELADLARRCGLQAGHAQGLVEDRTATPLSLHAWQVLPKLHGAMLGSADAGRAAAGFWRAIAPMPGSTEQFGQSFSMFRVETDGSIRVDTGFFTMRRTGWSIALGSQFFSCVSGIDDGYCAFTIMNRSPAAVLDVMDGIFLGCMADNGGVPIAMPVVMERIGNLTGDHDADEAHLAALLLINPVLAAADVAIDVRQRLALRPDHSALSMAALNSLASGRGPGV